MGRFRDCLLDDRTTSDRPCQVTSQPAFRRADPDARRQSLIGACARVLAREGAAGASVRTIAVEAGVSPGLIGHYFPALDDLIAATYAHVGARVEAALEAAVAAAAPEPRARLDAFVTASFAAPIADAELLATWIAFWSLVRTLPGMAAQHDGQYFAFRERLARLLHDCGLPRPRLRHAAIAVTALVDGLWLELCLSPGCFTPDEAGAMARQFLDRLVEG
ncbi:MAG: TetR family transcriptional regulator C-terminal domain-containing protein [Sphingomonadales bacterium]|nr:TetR family transcriptional regulator C-terminal domain-containing protein [Sphingomonadales bacterium]